MLFDAFFFSDRLAESRDVAQPPKRLSAVIWILFIGFITVVSWALWFQLDQVARASGEVIASSRVQIIQAVDGGELETLAVREGDRVQRGQVLARLDNTRLQAAVNEIEARLIALKAKAVRLRAEVMEADQVVFPEALQHLPELIAVEQALFKQKRQGLVAESKNLQTAIDLATEESKLTAKLARTGDVNRSEVIRAERALNETQAKLINLRNRYFEKAQSELTDAEDNIAQNEQVLAQRREQLENSVFTAKVNGIVKNIRVTTVGGVLRAGEELMQIIPVDDQLLLEAKVSPSDIALVRKGLDATLRFDPYDYTIFGGREWQSGVCECGYAERGNGKGRRNLLSRPYYSRLASHYHNDRASLRNFTGHDRHGGHSNGATNGYGIFTETDS